jgi:hypothetical protein
MLLFRTMTGPRQGRGGRQDGDQAMLKAAVDARAAARELEIQECIPRNSTG